MAGEKITKRVVDALKAPEPSKVGVKVRESFLWDRELRGFGVQVLPSCLKSFVIQYRTPEGRPRRVVCQYASNLGSDAISMMFHHVYDAPISLA